MLNLFPFLLSADSTQQQPGGGMQSWMTIGMIVLMIVFFYFFLIRPQKKQEKEATNMRNSLEVGDEIVTIGGIVGQVVSIKEETITIITSKDRTKIRFVKSAVREVTVKASGELPTTAAPKKKGGAIESAPVKDEPKATEAPAEAPAETPAADAPADDNQ